MNQLTIRLTHSTRFQLESLAERLGLTEAEIIKISVEKFYKSMENEMINDVKRRETNFIQRINEWRDRFITERASWICLEEKIASLNIEIRVKDARITELEQSLAKSYSILESEFDELLRQLEQAQSSD